MTNMVEPVENFFGRWRHAVTKVIYHNATSQTGPLAKSNVKNICSKIVQCIDIRDDSCQTRVHVGTQMRRTDCYISNECDKYLIANCYETFDERQKKLALDEKVKIIQRAFRSWRIMKIIKNCAKKYRTIIEDYKKCEEDKNQCDKKRIRISIIGQIFPQSRTEFAKLYALIDIWRQTQLREINENEIRDIDSRQREYCRILKQHVTLLRSIDKHRQYVVEDYKKKKLLKFLNVHCKTVKWNGYKGKNIEMVTLRVQKARELKILYDNLCCNNCTVEERIEMLIQLKVALDMHKCCEAIDLSHLIVQEMVLLWTGINAELLKNLSERISRK